MKLIGVKAFVFITVFLVTAGLIEYTIILHVHTKQRAPYMWVHDDLSKIEFENLPLLHKVQRFDSIRDKFYIDRDNFERIHNVLMKRSSQQGEKKTKENIDLAPRLLHASQEVRKPLVSTNRNSRNKALHVPEPPSSVPLSDSAKKAHPRESHSSKVDSLMSSVHSITDHFKKRIPKFNPDSPDQQPPDYPAQAVIERPESPDHVVSTDMNVHETKDDLRAPLSTRLQTIPVKRESQVYHRPPQTDGMHQYGNHYSGQQVKEGKPQVYDEHAKHDLGAHKERGEELRDEEEGDSTNEKDAKIFNKKEPMISDDYNYYKELELLKKKEMNIDINDFELIDSPNGLKLVKKTVGPEVLIEYDYGRQYRNLSLFERSGNNIMLTLRTTRKYHDQRLTLLYNTWMTKVNASNIFLVTDGEDKKWLKLASNRGMHYILTSCGKTYSQYQLCCKAGIELTLLFKESNKHYDWLCHVDDDMYVLLDPLTHILSKFNPKKEPVYFGRSGSEWYSPRKVKKGAKYGKPGQKYHFAVGGMYCLSRAMLELAKPYLVGGKTFAQSCVNSLEPEDVTVGYVVGVVLSKTLSRTEMIYTHGLHLISTVDPQTLEKQVAFSYGFGSTPWGLDGFNCIYVPDGLYSIEEDESQFQSLHCHLYPHESWCVKRQRELELHVGT